MLLDEEIQCYEGMVNHPDLLKHKEDAAKTALRKTKELMRDEGSKDEDECISDVLFSLRMLFNAFKKTCLFFS